VILRSVKLISASVIAGLVGAYLHYVTVAGAEAKVACGLGAIPKGIMSCKNAVTY
jgi:hypothetical protein